MYAPNGKTILSTNLHLMSNLKMLPSTVDSWLRNMHHFIDSHATQMNKKKKTSSTNLCTLHPGNVAMILQFHPVGFIQLGTDQKVQICNLVILTN